MKMPSALTFWEQNNLVELNYSFPYPIRCIYWFEGLNYVFMISHYNMPDDAFSTGTPCRMLPPATGHGDPFQSQNIDTTGRAVVRSICVDHDSGSHLLFDVLKPMHTEGVVARRWASDHWRKNERICYPYVSSDSTRRSRYTTHWFTPSVGMGFYIWPIKLFKAMRGMPLVLKLRQVL